MIGRPPAVTLGTGRPVGLIGKLSGLGLTIRQAVVNGILWTAHLHIPEKGAPIALVPKDLELPAEEPKKK
jgi:hypothetical protein